MKCPLCNTDAWCYIVDYPDYQGYICHECNQEMCEEQTQKILDTRDVRDMSLMLRQRAGNTNASFPIRTKNKNFINY